MKTKIFTLISLITLSVFIFASCMGSGGSKKPSKYSTGISTEEDQTVTGICSELEFSATGCSCSASADSAQLYCEGEEDACAFLVSVPTGYTCADNLLAYEQDPGNDEVAVVADPVFSPSATDHSSAINVTITSSTSGATIRYKYNTLMPTCSSGYTTQPIPINITTTKTINAIACKTGLTPSEVVSNTYTVTIPSA
jgi:hypothetical protein